MPNELVAPSARARVILLTDASRAIAAKYAAESDGLDIRHVWTDPRGAFFRVNWWRHFLDGTVEVSRVRRSAFVRVHSSGNGLLVEDRTKFAGGGAGPSGSEVMQPGAPQETGPSPKPSSAF